MAAIEWSNDLSVGVELIDSDHKTLIDLIKLVANSIEAGQTAKTIGDVVELLYEYTEFHFIREEVLMEACGYSDLDNHRKVHQSRKKRRAPFATSTPRTRALSMLRRYWNS